VVALNLEKARWRPERGEVTGTSVIVDFTMAKPPAMDGLTTMVHCDVLQLLSTWRTGGKWPTPARIISVSRRPSGYGELSSDRVRAYLGAKIFHSHRLSTLRRARIMTPARITARSSPAARYTASEDLFVHCTMVIFASLSDSTISGTIFSNLYVTPHEFTCIKVIVL
jgi:hypothetical protein